MIEAALEMCSYDPESATALLTDPSKVPALHRHLSRQKLDQRSIKRQVPISKLMVVQPYAKAAKQGPNNTHTHKLDNLDPVTAPPSYTVISGSGTVLKLPSAEAEGPTEAMSVMDGHIDVEERKTPQELAVEEREWREQAEQERMMVCHHSLTDQTSLVIPPTRFDLLAHTTSLTHLHYLLDLLVHITDLPAHSTCLIRSSRWWNRLPRQDNSGGCSGEPWLVT